MKLKKLNLLMAATTALGAGMMGPVQADVLSYAGINVYGFTIIDGNGTALDITDFENLAFRDQLTNTANLTPAVPNFDSEFAVSTTFVAATDALQACVGDCTVGENTFFPIAAPPTTTYARSDSLLQNQPISGTGFGVGTNAYTIAETSLADMASGGSDSTILLTTTLDFSLLADLDAGELGLMFDADTFIRTWTALGTDPGTLAGAGFSWNISLSEQGSATKLIEWAPDGSITLGTQTGLDVVKEDCLLAGATASATSSDPQSFTQCSGSFLAYTNFALSADKKYSFTINQTSSSQGTLVERVPEPATVALMGLGLLGLGFSARRRKV